MHKFIGHFFGKKVIAIQKLNSPDFEEQQGTFLFYIVQVQYVFHLLPCRHQGTIWLHARHFAIELMYFVHILLCLILEVLQGNRNGQQVRFIFYKTLWGKAEGGEMWRLRRPESGPHWPSHHLGKCLFQECVLRCSSVL